MLFMRGKAMSGAPIMSGTNQLPKPPISAGMTVKKIMISACAVMTTFQCWPSTCCVGAEILDAGMHQLGAHIDGEGAADEAGADREDKVHRADVLMVRRKQIAAHTGRMMVVMGVVVGGADGAHGSCP